MVYNEQKLHIIKYHTVRTVKCKYEKCVTEGDRLQPLSLTERQVEGMPLAKVSSHTPQHMSMAEI